MSNRILIIGCVQTKLDHPAKITDLYDSQLWRKRRATPTGGAATRRGWRA